MNQDNTPKPEGFQGKKNIYLCEECKGHIVTVDLDKGTTPFMTVCRATVECHGMMKSWMYRLFDQDIKPDHEWYKPGPNDPVGPAYREHVEMGGLLLRECSDK